MRPKDYILVLKKNVYSLRWKMTLSLNTGSENLCMQPETGAHYLVDETDGNQLKEQTENFH